MNANNDNSILKTEIHNAIVHFIKRQQLVAQVITELGLDLVEIGEFGVLGWSASGGMPSLSEQASDEAREMFDKLYNLRLRVKEKNVPQVGFWGVNQEWKYFLHGKGCLLENIHTGEPIDWDCPNVLAFDRYAFLKHLEWRFETEYRKNELTHTIAWIRQQPKGIESVIDLIGEMRDEGLINQDSTLSSID